MASLDLPLSARLSQTLVALTIEVDNQFELEMSRLGHPSTRLSLIVWLNLLRYLGEGTTTVHDLYKERKLSVEHARHMLGCLERWRILNLANHTAQSAMANLGRETRERIGKREGWGSGRGIRQDTWVRLTAVGLDAYRTWPVVIDACERRWQDRGLSRLQEILAVCIKRIGLDLPLGLPVDFQRQVAFLPAVEDTVRSLPTLLSQLLTYYTLDFDRESRLSLGNCATTLRVLSSKPTPLVLLPLLTGCSPETCQIGWQLRPYVSVEPDPNAKRGQVVTLNALGLQAQARYHDLTEELEARWEREFGVEVIRELRDLLAELASPDNGVLRECLSPPPGVVRSGAEIAALGRKDIGSAAVQRRKDIIAQTEAFLRDPEGALPHYPRWDMNRGFGP